MNKHLVWLALIFFFNQKSFAVAELIVKAGTVTISGYSAISSDLATIYGGIAGSPCATTDGITTCNSCIDGVGALNACNQVNVYSNLKFRISFQVTKSVSNAVAQLFIETSSPGVFDTLVTRPAANYVVDSSVITLETTWSEICSRAGLPNCTGTGALLASRVIKFGVDSDGVNGVEDAEKRTATIKLHYIPAGAIDVTQNYCPTTGTGAGVCNVKFLPGDAKVFIGKAIYNGDDASSTTTGGSVSWESIAVFPVETPLGGEAAVYTTFTNGRVSPIFKTIDPSTGDIPDSQVVGDIVNYKKYCMVYATKNKAQNIYKFVTNNVNTAESCVTPSEVSGILDGKSCFIATATFGSQSAPEVEIFRKFRNQFLLTNFLGKVFVKVYYKISPPIANIISDNNYLKIGTRILLSPLLLFAYLSLKIGFFITVLLLTFVVVLLIRSSRYFNLKKAAVIAVILLLTPQLKAEITPDEDKLSLPQAQEGLIRIKKDGTYIYDTERPLKMESSRITLGVANDPNVSLAIQQLDAQGNPTGQENIFTFADLYDETSSYILGYDYEWFPYIDKGKLGVQAGMSAMFANGHGRLRALPNGPSTESFTFVTMPLTLGGVYRMEWKDKQLIAPYLSGGGTYVLLIEKREDIATPKLIGGLGFYATGGLLLNIGALDRDAGFQLESEYGISNMWLSLEFRVIEVTSSAFSFSNSYLNAGLSFDF